MGDSLQSGNDPLDPTANTGTESLACVSCRSRKLKCDRIKPACTRCSKASAECIYPESRRKPTFKRRNVRELEARLAQVEGYLKEVTKSGAVDSEEQVDDTFIHPDPEIHQLGDFEFSSALPNQSAGVTVTPGQSQIPLDMPSDLFDDQTDGMLGGELMDLGLSESLPPFEMMEDLNNIYFNTQHFYIPIVHPGRYLKAFYGGPLMKPPMCLQYSIWALASYLNDKYASFSDIFYQRARQYVEADELKGVGEYFITLFHAQAYIILSTFEAKLMLFTRASMTSAKAVRLVQMMGLDRVDGEKGSIPPSLAPATSWAELEERRRTFWGAYCIDAHASISAGWPSLINCDDIESRLPASEEAFNSGKEEASVFIDEALKGASYSGFSSTIVTCRIFKKILSHVHRSRAKDRPEDLVNGPFWARHRELDNELSGAFMFLPEKFSLPRHYREPPAIHLNLNLHASVICLHHAAVEKAMKHGHPPSVRQASVTRLKTAAEEIVNIIKLTSHQLALFRSPLCALSMYCATTVYIFMAKENPEDGLDSIDTANLELIIQAMEAIARAHEITRSFLQQACLDVERNGLDAVIRLPNLSKYRDSFGGPASNIPLLARNHTIGSHTKISPVLPGRLPLGKPEGRIRPSSLRLPRVHPIAEDVGTTGQALRCFQGILGAATRNNKTQSPTPSTVPPMMESEAGSDTTTGSQPPNKRKRTSPEEANLVQGTGMESISISRSEIVNMSFLATENDGFSHVLGDVGQFDLGTAPNPNIILAHRTSSSTASSSPMNNIINSFGTDTRSGSDETSPEQLSNKPQQIPLWGATDAGFFGQLNDGSNAERNEIWNMMNVGL
ncbi:unnamed protein product [Clonostachys chloroleuca]|uniref:Zn(2)-C6 fungal-type domain-containing protein n=1 Tax=Clonostachys chloroleuca TaxID=1926264 RepID=A0AA35LW18_9HYPO|nr:unnamed protein product [Clonostachys chloroleuca]